MHEFTNLLKYNFSNISYMYNYNKTIIMIFNIINMIYIYI